MKLLIGSTPVLEIMRELMSFWRLSVFGKYCVMHSHFESGNERKKPTIFYYIHSKKDKTPKLFQGKQLNITKIHEALFQLPLKRLHY